MILVACRSAWYVLVYAQNALCQAYAYISSSDHYEDYVTHVQRGLRNTWVLGLKCLTYPKSSSITYPTALLSLITDAFIATATAVHV